MTKRIILAWMAVFIAWFMMDWIIHGKLLMQTYVETANLWRPEAEMKPYMIWLANIVSALCMVLIYAWYFGEKTIRSGLVYGALLGVMWGMGAGYATYGYMPIPYFLAQAWFWAMLVESVVAGAIIGFVVRD